MGIVIQEADSFFQGVQTGMQQEAAKDGVQLKFVNVNNDPSQELNVVDTFIAAKVDAILLSPLNNKGSLQEFKDALTAGIPVFCYNTCIAPSDMPTYVKAAYETDVKSLGTSTGQYLAKYITDKLSGKATVGILQCDRLGVGCSDRVAGLKESLSTLPGVQYAADQEGFMADASTPVAQAILSAHPDINILWAENEGGTVGEVTAVRSANRAGKVFVFGTDITPQIAQFLLDPDGILVASTGQSPEAMGQQAIQGALTVIHGQTISPLVSYTPVTLYTRDNPADVQAYIAAHPAK